MPNIEPNTEPTTAQPPAGAPATTPPATGAATPPATPATPAQPPAGSGGVPPASTTTQTTTPPAGGDVDEPISVEKARELRRENATLRERAKTAEDKNAEFERANMTEAEKLKADAAKATADATAARSRLVDLSVKDVARDLGFANPAIAARLIDRDKLTFDADGNPSNAKDLLTLVLTENPNLKSTGAGTTPPAGGLPPSGGGNPPGSGDGALKNEDVVRATNLFPRALGRLTKPNGGQ